ncbi:ORF1 viral helicase [Erysiphe necator nege-like virus 1]|nr:ORF1 viral helicase [Erysiphe necator nege-like virus 1]
MVRPISGEFYILFESYRGPLLISDFNGTVESIINLMPFTSLLTTDYSITQSFNALFPWFHKQRSKQFLRICNLERSTALGADVIYNHVSPTIIQTYMKFLALPEDILRGGIDHPDFDLYDDLPQFGSRMSSPSAILFLGRTPIISRDAKIVEINSASVPDRPAIDIETLAAMRRDPPNSPPINHNQRLKLWKAVITEGLAFHSLSHTARLRNHTEVYDEIQYLRPNINAIRERLTAVSPRDKFFYSFVLDGQRHFIPNRPDNLDGAFDGRAFVRPQLNTAHDYIFSEYTNCQYNERLALAIEDISSREHAIVPDVIRVQAVAGAGKTREIIELVRSNPRTSECLIITHSRSARDDLERRLRDRINDIEPNFDFRNRVRTMDSFLINGIANAPISALFIDECCMDHPSSTIAAILSANCVDVRMYGDSKQIGFVNFIHDTIQLRYTVAGVFPANEYMRISYRVPVDIAAYMAIDYADAAPDQHAGLISASEIDDSVRLVRITGLGDIRVEPGVQYLCHTNQEVAACEASGLLPCRTISTYQGCEHANIRYVRINTAKTGIYNEQD